MTCLIMFTSRRKLSLGSEYKPAERCRFSRATLRLGIVLWVAKAGTYDVLAVCLPRRKLNVQFLFHGANAVSSLSVDWLDIVNVLLELCMISHVIIRLFRHDCIFSHCSFDVHHVFASLQVNFGSL